MTTPIIKQLDPLAPSHELTSASVWQAAAGSRFGDHLLE